MSFTRADAEVNHAIECVKYGGILLTGDSYAASLSIGINELLESKDISFGQLLNLLILIHRKSCNSINERILKQ